MRLLLERLEDRLTPALLTVTTGADAGAGSLREALAAANNGDVIDFAPGVQLIGLTSGGLTIAADVAVRNDQGAGPVTVDGGGQFTVFTVNKGVTASLSGLTITRGNGSDVGGGGVLNRGALTVSDCTFSGNATSADGGGVLTLGALVVDDSTFSGNVTQFGAGGGIADNGGAATIRDSTFSGNNAGGGGGGVNNSGGLVTLMGDVLVGNIDGDLLPDDVAGSGVDPSSSSNVVGADMTGSLPAGQGNQVNVTAAQAGLAPLGAYGGLTPTFALLPGSVALGAGQTESGATDQRGFARPDGALADAGAFQSAPLVVTSAADADAPGLLTLRDALNLADVDTTPTAEPITFDPTAFAAPTTITLTAGGLNLAGAQASISITGSAAGVTIDGGGNFTVFTVNGVTASLDSLTIADGFGNQGGGVVNAGGVLTVADCTFLNNAAATAGAGLYNGSGSATVDDCTFSGNVTGGAGGAVFNAGRLTISNSTLSGNRAGSGGAAFNTAGVRPAAVFVLLGDILVGNTGGAGADDVAGAAFNGSSAFNLIGVDQTGSLTNGANGNQVGVTVAEAGLAPLGNNGGPTETFALLGGSLALGAGLTEATPTYDQRGAARPVGSPGDAGSYQAVFPPENLALNLSADVSEIGTPVTLGGAFDDGRTNQTDTVTIVWDDGSADTTLTLPAGTLAFNAAHTYTTEGDYFPVVFVTNGDGLTTAAASEEQVLPSPFSDVVDLKGVPGQTVAGLSADPVTGNIISTEFTVFAGDGGVGEFLAAQLNGVTLPPTRGALTAVAAYDFREHNLGPNDSVEVFLIIHTSLAPKAVPELLYLDPRTGQEQLFRGDVLFAVGPNVLFVSILFNNADAPRLIDLTDTVFTVAVAAPAAPHTTTTAAFSPPVASSDPAAAVVVQTTSFQSTSQLRLTLATTELSQVSQSASSLAGNGGGSEGEGGGDDGLAEMVAHQLEALFESVADEAAFRFLAQPRDNAGPPTPHGMAPDAPDANPPQPAPPDPLSFGRMLPLRDVVVEPAPAGALPGIDRGPGRRRKVHPVAPSAAYALAAPLIGAGLVVPVRRPDERRRTGAVTSFPSRPATS